jgi:hypothetical protein
VTDLADRINRRVREGRSQGLRGRELCDYVGRHGAMMPGEDMRGDWLCEECGLPESQWAKP